MDNKVLLQDLSNGVSKRSGLAKKDSENFVRNFFAVIEQYLQEEKIVKVKGLGTFKVVEVSGRDSVNVNTGERIHIKGHSKITFTPDAAIRDYVNRPFADFDTIILNEGVDLKAMEYVDDASLENSNEQDEDVTIRTEDITIRPEDVTIRPEEIVETIPAEEIDVTIRTEEVEETVQEEVLQEEVTEQPAEENITEQPAEENVIEQPAEEEVIEQPVEEEVEETTPEDITLKTADILDEDESSTSLPTPTQETTVPTLRMEASESEFTEPDKTIRLPEPLASFGSSEVEEMPTEKPAIEEEPAMEEDPIAEEPAMEEDPTVEEEPVAEEPSVDEEPITEEPIADEEPIAEQPVDEEPVAEEPVVDEDPVAEEPIVDEEPIAEEPVVAEEPIVEEPVEVAKPEKLSRRNREMKKPRYVVSHSSGRGVQEDVDSSNESGSVWTTIAKIVGVLVLMFISYLAGSNHILDSGCKFAPKAPEMATPAPQTTDPIAQEETDEPKLDDPYRYANEDDASSIDVVDYDEEEELIDESPKVDNSPQIPGTSKPVAEKKPEPTKVQNDPKPATQPKPTAQPEKTNPAVSYPQVKGGVYEIVGVKCSHTLKAGESVSKVARQYLGDPKLNVYIIKLNNISNPDIVEVGQVLKVPELKKK